MKAQYHILSSLPIGGGTYLMSHDALSTLFAMGASVFIDIDHIIDYIITQKRIDSLQTMLKAFESFSIVNKNYFFFHSWEAIIALCATFLFWPHEYIAAILFGYSIHLLIDQIYNTCFLGRFSSRNAFYFFLFRLKHNFDVLPLRKHAETIDITDNIYEQ
jgi:hypothetical protein